MAYFKFISMAFQRAIAYRVEYYTALLNAFLYIFIFTSVWKALIPEGSNIGGLSQQDMVAYAVLSTLLKVSFGRNESMLGDRVRSGEIAVDLMKPYSFPLMLFCDTVGVSLFQLFARAVPILIFCIFLFDISLPVTPELLLQFLPVYFLSFIIFFSMFFLIGTLAFYFVDIFPFWILYFAMITLTSGAIIPLDFFPPWVQAVLLRTPFPYLFYFPSMVLLGKTMMISYPELIVTYVFLAIGTLSLGALSYRGGLRKLSIAGG